MRRGWKEHIRLQSASAKYFAAFILIFMVAELLVNPLRHYPLNDDWSYTKSVFQVLVQSHYDIGQWPAMTLWTHIMWGQLFTKIFGFSFVSLRFSTMVSAVIGFFFLFRMVRTASGNPSLAFVSCLILLFNPVYFNLANTFMTDVNFNTLLILCCYSAFVFYRTLKLLPVLFLVLLSVLLVLTRQYGIIVPAAFTFSTLFLREKKLKYFLIAGAGTVLVYLSLKFYESYLREILAEGSAYEFSDKAGPHTQRFWDRLHVAFVTRWNIILLSILVYAAPFTAMTLRELCSRSNRMVLAAALIVSLLSSYLLFHKTHGLIGNIFTNMAVGAETFYENLKPVAERDFHPPTYSATFDHASKVFQVLAAALTMFWLLLKLWRVKKGWQSVTSPFTMLLLSLAALYVFMLLITESFFDRYLIPVYTLTILLAALAARDRKPRYLLASVWLLIFAYISVAGTRDYFTLNDVRWEAYYALRRQGVPREKINGGFEINCWHDGEPYIFYDHMIIESHDYLIQYHAEEHFRLLRELPFQRYFPYKKDKINIFVREQPHDYDKQGS